MRQGNPDLLPGPADDHADLRDSEDRFRKALEFLPTPIGIADDSGNILHYNAAFTQQYGYRLDDIPTIDAWLLRAYPDPSYRAEVLRQWEADVAAALRDATCTVPREYRIRCLDGSQKYVEIILQPLHGLWIAIFTDITERKKAEDAIKESEFKYRLLFENMTTGFALHEMLYDDAGRPLDYRYLEVNPAFEKLTGVPVKALLGKTVKEVLPNTEQYWIDAAGKVATTGEPMEFINYSQEIGKYFQTWLFSPEQGKFAVIFNDITESKQAENFLRAQREFIDQALDAQLDTLFVFEPHTGKALRWNKRFCEVTGYSDDEIANLKAPDAYYDRADLQRASTVIARVEREGSGTVELDLLCKDGRRVPFEYVVSTMQTSPDEPTKFISIGRDITERRLLEEERLKLQKLESVGTLAGGIAHDFNNLLQGVFGHVSLAKSSLDRKDRCLRMLDQAEKALHKSVSLTNQLLTFAKGGTPVKRPLDLPPVLESAVAFALSGSHVGYQIEIDEPLERVLADEGQISQVVQNIALNADHAMPAGGIITIVARNVRVPDDVSPHGLRDGNYVEISTRDTGIGIPAQYIDRVFDPYFTTKDHGSGLGLATSYSIIRNHAGAIEVSSQPGEGTEFRVYLPATRVPAQSRASTAPPESVAAAGAGCVLVMDDEEIVRTVAGELLRTLGYEVDIVQDGDAAIARYQAARKLGRPYDLVILDLTMRGGMGGAEVLRKLLEIDPAVKALVSSGYSDDASISDYQEQGFRAFLKKPYTLDDLRAVLSTVLGT